MYGRFAQNYRKKLDLKNILKSTGQFSYNFDAFRPTVMSLLLWFCLSLGRYAQNYRKIAFKNYSKIF